MTREEQIRQAGIEYTYRNRPMCIGGGAFSEMVDEMNRNKAVEEGAKWADEHPNLTEEEVGMGGLGMECNSFTKATALSAFSCIEQHFRRTNS